MSKSRASRGRNDPSLYNDTSGDKIVEMPAIMDSEGDQRAASPRGKRLRNAIILANAAVWVAIIVLAKWFFF